MLLYSSIRYYLQAPSDRLLSARTVLVQEDTISWYGDKYSMLVLKINIFLCVSSESL